MQETSKNHVTTIMAAVNPGRETSSWFEGWERWQIALAVGAPVCLGLAGLWFYNRNKKTDDQTRPELQMKPKSKAKVTQKLDGGTGSAAGTSGENAAQPKVVIASHDY